MLKNDRSHDNSMISRLKLHQWAKAISISNNRTEGRAVCTNREMRRNNGAKRRSKFFKLENG